MPHVRLLPLLLSLCLVAASLAACGEGSSGGDSDANSGSADTEQSAGAPEVDSPGSEDGVVSASNTEDVIAATRELAQCRDAGATRPQEQRKAVDTLIRVMKVGPEDRFEYGSGGVAVSMEGLVERYAGILERCDERDLANTLRQARASV